jgi:hypothetical protein
MSGSTETSRSINSVTSPLIGEITRNSPRLSRLSRPVPFIVCIPFRISQQQALSLLVQCPSSFASLGNICTPYYQLTPHLLVYSIKRLPRRRFLNLLAQSIPNTIPLPLYPRTLDHILFLRHYLLQLAIQNNMSKPARITQCLLLQR